MTIRDGRSPDEQLADVRRRLGWVDGKPPAGASLYMAKCKRLRTDGPTPCYCCPGECVGEVDLPLDVQESFYRQMRQRQRKRHKYNYGCVVRGLIAFGLLTAVLLAAIVSASHDRRAFRDLRCETPARYEAMRQGADCS